MADEVKELTPEQIAQLEQQNQYTKMIAMAMQRGCDAGVNQLMAGVKQMPRLRKQLQELLMAAARLGMEAGFRLGIDETQITLGLKQRPSGVTVAQAVQRGIGRG